METNKTGHKFAGRPTTISLPPVNHETTPENQSSLFKRLSQEDLLSPDSNDIVHTWLLVQPESNKHVQFARKDINTSGKKIQTPRVIIDTADSLPDIDQHIPRLDLTAAFQPNQSAKKKEDQIPRNHDIHVAAITGAKFYRSSSHKTFSISSSIASSSSRARQSPLVPNPSPILRHRPLFDEPPSSIISTSTIRDRSLNLSLLELNPVLSDFDRKKFEDIRQQVPDEFEQLLPTLLRLCVVLWPKKFFENTEQLTIKERKQRQRFSAIIEKDQEECDEQQRFKRLYGNNLPPDDISHRRNLLRGTLSFQGQLALLETYRDMIESELTNKIHRWRSIPMRAMRTSFMDETSSINRSSIISNTFQAKHKFLQGLSSRKTQKSYSTVSQFSTEELFALALPDQIDEQWQRKSLVKIIEQGMHILDQARELYQPNLSDHDDDLDLNAHALVRTFKGWLFVWSTLFIEDKYLR